MGNTLDKMFNTVNIVETIIHDKTSKINKIDKCENCSPCIKDGECRFCFSK